MSHQMIICATVLTSVWRSYCNLSSTNLLFSFLFMLFWLCFLFFKHPPELKVNCSKCIWFYVGVLLLMINNFDANEYEKPQSGHTGDGTWEQEKLSAGLGQIIILRREILHCAWPLKHYLESDSTKHFPRDASNYTTLQTTLNPPSVALFLFSLYPVNLVTFPLTHSCCAVALLSIKILIFSPLAPHALSASWVLLIDSAMWLLPWSVLCGNEFSKAQGKEPWWCL